MSEILKINTYKIHVQDSIIWESTVDGAISVNTANKSCKSINTSNTSINWLWKSKLPPYIKKNFFWKVFVDALPTAEMLNKFYNRVPARCSLCDLEDEDSNPFFFNYNTFYSYTTLKKMGNIILELSFQPLGPFKVNMDSLRKRVGRL